MKAQLKRSFSNSVRLFTLAGISCVSMAANAANNLECTIDGLNYWNSGFTINNVTVTNTTGESISDWQTEIQFASEQNVTSTWNALVSEESSDNVVTFTAQSYNGSLSAEESTTFGLQGSYSGEWQVPTCVISEITETDESTSDYADSISEQESSDDSDLSSEQETSDDNDLVSDQDVSDDINSINDDTDLVTEQDASDAINSVSDDIDTVSDQDTSEDSDSTSVQDTTDDSDSSSSENYVQSYSLSLDLSGGGYSEAQIETLVSESDSDAIYTEDEIIELVDSAVIAVKGDQVSFENDLYTDYQSEEYVVIDGSTDNYYISEAGTYLLSGEINSTITIEIDEEEDVRLILNGVSITSDTGPAIVVVTADDVEISVVAGTENYLEDASTREDAAADYTGALYSDCDLVLNGSGTLYVTANYNNGIITKDDLKLINLSVDVTSVDDGITGKDSVAIYQAELTIDAEGDALKSTHDDDAEKGYIVVDSGTINIQAGDDAVSAENVIAIYDGDFTIQAEGKGIKSESEVIIAYGSFAIDSSDDSIDSNTDLTIYDGVYSLASGSDALKATEYLTVSGGRIDVTSSVEGVEAQYITLNSGHLSIDTSDDGINASSDYSNNTLAINGGAVVVTSFGDSIDVNGSAQITGGTIIANGPTSNQGNSTFDIDNGYGVDGGVIFAFGNSTMAVSPSTNSAQPSVTINSNSFYAAGSTVTLVDANDNDIMSLASLNSFDNVIISHPDLSIGSSYSVTFDGSSLLEFTLSSSSTTVSDSDSSDDLFDSRQESAGNRR